MADQVRFENSGSQSLRNEMPILNELNETLRNNVKHYEDVDYITGNYDDGNEYSKFEPNYEDYGGVDMDFQRKIYH